jgi:hypothetical protein
MAIGLGGAVLIIALLFLAYYKGKDENKNGVPDALEKITTTISTTKPN